MLCTIVSNVEYIFLKVYFNCLFHGLNAFGNYCCHLYPTNGGIGATYDIFNIAGWFIERKGEKHPPPPLRSSHLSQGDNRLAR